MTYPASLSTRTITGVILTADGAPASGTIRLTRAIPLQGPGDDITIQPGAHTATLDTTGAYSLTVPVSDDVEATSGAGALNARFTRSGAAGPLPWRVRFRRRRLTRAVRPEAAISCAIVLSDTCQPCSRNSIPTRGLP